LGDAFIRRLFPWRRAAAPPRQQPRSQPRTVLAFGGAAALLVAAVITKLGCSEYVVLSASMEPTLHCARATGCESLTADRILVSGWIYRLRPVERGDVVVVRSQTGWCGSGDAVIKRVIGIPGDRVKVLGRAVVVNGRLAVPPTTDRTVRGRIKALRLGAGRYFLVGDNTNVSCDSRSRGPVPRDTIVGKAVLISSPLNRIRLL
jgi:signal peptidase I